MSIWNPFSWFKKKRKVGVHPAMGAPYGLPKPTRPAPPMPSIKPPLQSGALTARAAAEETARRRRLEERAFGTGEPLAYDSSGGPVTWPGTSPSYIGGGGTFDGGGASGDWDSSSSSSSSSDSSSCSSSDSSSSSSDSSSCSSSD